MSSKLFPRLRPREGAIARLFCLGLFLALSACELSPERKIDQVGSPVPTLWSGTDSLAGQVPENWLEEFQAPELAEIVRDALERNYDLKAAAARVEQARQQALIDGAPIWPQLSFSPDYQRSQVRSAGFGSSEFGAYQAVFNLDWELDIWGRLRNLRDASRIDADASAADLHAARLSLAARSAQSYFELAEASLQVEVAEQSIRDRRKIVELVRGRFARGLTRGLDLRLALTDLANARSNLAIARNQVQMISRRLEVLLGRYPAAKLSAKATLPEPPGPLSAGVPSELMSRRPDLIAAFDRLKSADLRVEGAKKALLPRITLTASGGTRSPALTELADPRAAVWNLAMGLVQPLFTGGRLSGQIDLNEAFAEEALNLYKSTALNAFREVEQVLAAEEWLREQERALKEGVEQTESSRKLAVYSYQQGLIEILTLLDSYRSTFSAQSAYLLVKRQLLNNRIDLYLALGGAV